MNAATLVGGVMQVPRLLAPLVRVFDAVSEAVGRKSENGRKISLDEWAEIFAAARGVVDEAVKLPIEQGDAVLVRLPDRHGSERWRPGRVLQAFGPTCANVAIDLDAFNDADIAIDDLGRFVGTPIFAVDGTIGGRAQNVAAYGTSLSAGLGVGQWRRA